jgi:quercetin dioxygenase-like cupin family protein
MNTTVQMANAMALATNEGERLSWLGEPTVLKVTGAETAGHYAIAEVTSTPEGFVPLHVHNNEDEAFLIMDGEVDFTVGGRIFSAGPGAFVFGPRGVPHSYKVKTPSARLMMIFSPAGFEGFIRETSIPLDAPQEPGDMDMDKLMETAARYGAEILGE